MSPISSGEFPAFSEPLHVGRPNIVDPEGFLARISGVLDRRWLSNDGPLVRELEEAIARKLGVKHCVAVVNGTIALEIAIKVLGLTGEVIVPSWTFVATAHSLRWHGITPVFADIDPDTHCLDPQSVHERITERTSAILAVHLWGNTAPVAELQSVADEAGIKLFFDAAHAFGVKRGDTHVGNFGALEVMSFHATKFFNAIEGGAITTNDDDVAERARLMRNFGFRGEDNVVSLGTNGKMNEICAAMALSNLGGIDDLIEANKERYDTYARELARVPGVRLLPSDPQGSSNYQYVVLLVDEDCSARRDDILQALRANNVLARRYFWPGVHNMEPYRTEQPDSGARLPQTARVSDQVVVLPTGTALALEDIPVIVDVIAGVVAAGDASKAG